ncbi:hypothetical protein [uncultured Flavobacterium sp.]|uniref:hypothetical protein n=1 Tax=uncultured Flavobacterium sp. TaxID=165435 RepID=UPI0025D9BE68|nr:hypothetical protein [uncultured Flavobacterium sp.]
MNDKHNIDRLFQEKFKDFEVTPPEFVWENIEEALREKKKKRVIPLWVKLSGVAAVLVMGSVFIYPYLDRTVTKDNPVVIDRNGNKRITPTDKPIPNNGTILVDSTLINSQNSAVASGESNTGENGKTSGGPAKKAVPANATAPFRQSNDAMAHGSKTGTSNSNLNKRHSIPEGNRYKKHQPAGYHREAIAGTARSDAGKIGNDVNADIPANTNQKFQEKSASGTAVAGSDKGQNRPDIKSQEEDIPAGTQKSPIIKNDIPGEQEAIAEAPADTATVPAAENPLEELLRDKLNGNKDKEEQVAENGDKGRWNIKPQIAPLFYNSLSAGSPIDGQFAANSKSFDNDLSYGVGINYAVTDRLSVRSGINSLNLSYATNDVQFRPSLSGHTNNVSATAKTANIVVTARQNPANIPGVINGFTTLSVSEQSFNGSMVQSTGYIEVPVEMSYALINKKFGVDVIGGVSTLFLNENNISVISNQGYSTQVGEAQNLNSVHFSTNIGVGFKYRFWKSFQANFEPTFKYQVNAYSRDAGNFKPYFIGLYSGISFSF